MQWDFEVTSLTFFLDVVSGYPCIRAASLNSKRYGMRRDERDGIGIGPQEANTP